MHGTTLSASGRAYGAMASARSWVTAVILRGSRIDFLTRNGTPEAPSLTKTLQCSVCTQRLLISGASGRAR